MKYRYIVVRGVEKLTPSGTNDKEAALKESYAPETTVVDVEAGEEIICGEYFSLLNANP